MRARAVLGYVMVAAALAACQSRTVDTAIAAPRGTIRDRAGQVLAIDTTAGRAYPLDRLGEHTIGDVARAPSLGMRGRSGVEAAWDETLRGRPGVRRAPIDAPAESTIVVEPTPGSDVTLTLDATLMPIITRAYRGNPSGAVVVVDVRDGSVLALFSSRSFDRAQLAPEDGLVDRTIGVALPAGGTLKPFAILAALEAGALDPDERIACDGTVWDPYPHGVIDAREAIAVSCGSFAATLADRVGLEAITDVARDFGLGASTDLGLQFELAGHLADANRTDIAPRELAVEAAIGIGVEVTPLQLALAYAAIANGGTLWRPRLTTDRAPLVRRRVHATAEQLALVREGLDRAVNDENGAAFTADGGPIRIAGKHGHGRVSGSPDIVATWFAGYAPASDPTLAIVVMVEGNGQRRPASVAARIVDQYLASDR